MVPDEIRTLDEAVDAFNMAKDQESDAQFDQSDTAARACVEFNRRAWGMTDAQILRHMGEQTDTSQSTLRARLLVGRVFPKEKREAPENAWCRVKRWTHFEVCARMYSDETPNAPWEWLEYCVTHDLSVRRLKADIEALSGAPPPNTRPLYFSDAEMMTVDGVGDRSITLRFDRPRAALELADGDRVVVTIVKESEPTPMPI